MFALVIFVAFLFLWVLPFCRSSDMCSMALRYQVCTIYMLCFVHSCLRLLQHQPSLVHQIYSSSYNYDATNWVFCAQMLLVNIMCDQPCQLSICSFLCPFCFCCFLGFTITTGLASGSVELRSIWFALVFSLFISSSSSWSAEWRLDAPLTTSWLE